MFNYQQCYFSNVNEYENGNDWYAFTKMNGANYRNENNIKTIMMSSETYKN